MDILKQCYEESFGKTKKMKIKFKGKSYLLIGNLKHGGAISTEKQYGNFETSFAHLFPDGIVRRFGIPIGTKKDISIARKGN